MLSVHFLTDKKWDQNILVLIYNATHLEATQFWCGHNYIFHLSQSHKLRFIVSVCNLEARLLLINVKFVLLFISQNRDEKDDFLIT